MLLWRRDNEACIRTVRYRETITLRFGRSFVNESSAREDIWSSKKQ